MDIERVSDIAQNIADIAAIRLDKKIKMSKKGTVEIKFMADKINESFERLMEALEQNTAQSA